MVELKEYITWLIYFLDLLQIGNNCAKIHYCRMCVTNFKEGWPLPPPPHPWAVRNSPSWIRLNATPNYKSLLWKYERNNRSVNIKSTSLNLVKELLQNFCVIRYASFEIFFKMNRFYFCLSQISFYIYITYTKSF